MRSSVRSRLAPPCFQALASLLNLKSVPLCSKKLRARQRVCLNYRFAFGGSCGSKVRLRERITRRLSGRLESKIEQKHDAIEYAIDLARKDPNKTWDDLLIAREARDYYLGAGMATIVFDRLRSDSVVIRWIRFSFIVQKEVGIQGCRNRTVAAGLSSKPEKCR